MQLLTGCGTFLTMRRGWLRQLSVLAGFALLLGQVVSVPAQEMVSGAEDPIQPDVVLAFSGELESMSSTERRAAELVFSAVEAEFRSQRRYDLRRVDAAADFSMNEIAVSGAELRVIVRRDGTLGVETDVWDGSAYVASGVYELPVGDERFATADDIAIDLADEVAAIHGGFARLRFTNSGARQPFYVFVNEVFMGASIDEIELPVDRYEVEVRRRDDGFEHVVGTTRVSLEADDFIDIRFSMSRTPPPVPGFMRLSNPEDRWRVLFDLRASYYIPLAGLDFFEPDIALGGTGTALFNDVGIRGVVVGLEAGHIYVSGFDTLSPTDIAFTITPAMGTFGFSVGPISGVDFVLRGAGGIALTRSIVGFDDGAGERSEVIADGFAPVLGGVFEFGFGLGEAGRASLHASYLGLLEGSDLYSWVGLGVGIGGRF